MKKNYITPEINVIQPESLLCSFMQASVYNGSTGGECIDNFGVVNENDPEAKDYEGLWGNSGKWGDD